MKFSTHPLLKDLKVNEDGSQIYWRGNLLDIKSYKPNRNNYAQMIVNFNSQTHTVIKVVCEAWNGMRETPNQAVKRKDFNPNNNHYTNLYWGDRGGTRTKKTKRVKTSKIKESDIAEIIERIDAGEPLAKIAKFYHTSDMSIHRIKRNYMEDRMAILKRAIMKARDNYEKRLAYAKYYGFDTIGNAVDAFGKNTFILKCQRLAL